MSERPAVGGVPGCAELGCALRVLRRARHVTIEDLALAAGLHPTYLSGIERGVRNPSWVKLAGLARALDVPVSVIVKGAEGEAEVARAVRAARTRIEVESR